MKQLLPPLDPVSTTPLYIQLYEYLKGAILAGDLPAGERLPSLRGLAGSLPVSITTVQQAYAQLLVEGYIESRPHSGYYIRATKAGIRPPNEDPPPLSQGFLPAGDGSGEAPSPMERQGSSSPYLYDLSCFDFPKWKKCYNSVLNDQPDQLLFEGDPQGEAALRQEIARYVFSSRGVRCSPERVVIAAGTQQITSHIATLLRRMEITNVSVEDPGYAPVTSLFRERGFALFPIPVTQEGIRIEQLPVNLASVAYVNPSNQFPSGAVMPIARRMALLQWAKANHSYIIEDDYDSELRYFGRPIPALQGLDDHDRVIYLGSFSSTLFPAAKISYMVLPERMVPLCREIMKDYTQSCSKAEQLALALFMERGYYRRGINKLRRLYAAKLQLATKILSTSPQVTVHDTASGISLLMDVETDKPATVLCREAREVGIEAFFLPPSAAPTVPDPQLPAGSDAGTAQIGLYYTRIPLEKIEKKLGQLLTHWELT